jgi:hypothetical protein
MEPIRDVRKRNRLIVLLLFPVTTIVWLCGWILYWKGSQSGPLKMPTPTSDNGIEIRAAIFEETEQFNT